MNQNAVIKGRNVWEKIADAGGTTRRTTNGNEIEEEESE